MCARALGVAVVQEGVDNPSAWTSLRRRRRYCVLNCGVFCRCAVQLAALQRLLP
jgi:hypothetical protein